jgi:nicotinate-nucleotide adenylyltransferase
VRLGVFGGTFDPLHNGHLLVALDVRHRLALDRMLLVVANDPWQKADAEVTPAQIRFALVAEAVDRVNERVGESALEASDIEIRRGGETYTADTLAALQADDSSAELFMLVGSDAAAGLDSWKRPDELRRLATTVVVDRGGREGGRPPAGWTHEVVDVPLMEVSSSDLRRRIAEGDPVEALMPPTVIDGIRRLGLYHRTP